MRNLLILFAICLASLGMGQDWAKKRLDDSPRHQEWIEVKNGSRTVKCFVVYPERKDKTKVVLVIHEIMGLTDWAMGVADQLAEHGYIAIAPDFLSGMGPNGGRTKDFKDVSAVREAISGIQSDQVIGDLNAAFEYAKKIPSGNGKIAVTGFCWGGSQTFRYATAQSGLVGAFPFYGTAPVDGQLLAKIACPVFGFYGGDDDRVTATTEDTAKLMKENNKKYEKTVYEGAGHGFMRSGEQPDAKEANKKARDAAWKRLLELLAKS